MLSQIAEWYKTTDIEKNDERLTQRRTAADALVVQWEKAASGQMVDVVCLALEICLPTHDGKGGALDQVLAAIVDAQPTFEPKQKAASLDPRICAAVALNEMLHRRLSKSETVKRKEPSLVAAQALASALRHRSVATGDFLNDKIEGLLTAADALLTKLDQGRRTRKSSSDAVSEADLAGEDGLEVLQKGVMSALSSVERNARLDREELQALWWVFGEFSLTQKSPFKELSSPVGPLMSGVELSQLVSWPGSIGIAMLAARMAELSAGKDKKNFDTLCKDVDEKVWLKCVEPEKRPVLEGRDIVFPILSAASDDKHRLPKQALLRKDLSRAEIAIQTFTERCLLAALAG